MTPATKDTDIQALQLFEKIDNIIQEAQKRVKTTINLTMVYAYYEIGRSIFEEEQDGKARAEYGAYMLESVADRLTKKYNRGYSADNLKLMRRFYVVYSQDKIRETLFPRFTDYPVTSSGERFYLRLSKRLISAATLSSITVCCAVSCCLT